MNNKLAMTAVVAFSTGITVTLLVLKSMEPSGRNDCLLSNLEGVASERAAVQIIRACREMYPDKSGAVDLSGIDLKIPEGQDAIDDYLYSRDPEPTSQ